AASSRATASRTPRASAASFRSAASPWRGRPRPRADWLGLAPRYCGAAPPTPPRHRWDESENRRTSWSHRNQRTGYEHRTWAGFRVGRSRIVQRTIAYMERTAIVVKAYYFAVQQKMANAAELCAGLGNVSAP